MYYSFVCTFAFVCVCDFSSGFIFPMCANVCVGCVNGDVRQMLHRTAAARKGQRQRTVSQPLPHASIGALNVLCIHACYVLSVYITLPCPLCKWCSTCGVRMVVVVTVVMVVVLSSGEAGK